MPTSCGDGSRRSGNASPSIGSHGESLVASREFAWVAAVAPRLDSHYRGGLGSASSRPASERSRGEAADGQKSRNRNAFRIGADRMLEPARRRSRSSGFTRRGMSGYGLRDGGAGGGADTGIVDLDEGGPRQLCGQRLVEPRPQAQYLARVMSDDGNQLYSSKARRVARDPPMSAVMEAGPPLSCG